MLFLKPLSNRYLIVAIMAITITVISVIGTALSLFSVPPILNGVMKIEWAQDSQTWQYMAWFGSNAVKAASPPSPADTQRTLRYQVDYSQVPSLTYRDLTLKVTVGQVGSAQVFADGSLIDHNYDSATGIIRFTTSATTVEVVLTNDDNASSLGEIIKAPLKDDKDFAWSLGLDDNVGLKATVNAMDRFNWGGTFFVIGNIIDDTRNEDWIVDAPYLQQKLASGWAIGNHTWDHTCSPPINEQIIIDTYTRLQGIVDASSRPNYQIISFAAPCFAPEYHPIILNHRDNGITPVQFNESGNRTPLIVDPGVSEDIYLDDEPDIPQAYAFNYDLPIGRDTYLEANEPQSLTSILDWMALRHAEYGEHMWHNTLVHGDREALIEPVVTYLDSAYGPNGTDQVWVAPSDQIYSYILVRDQVQINLLGIDPPIAPPVPITSVTPTATSLPTMRTSTPTSMIANTPTATSTPIATPTTTLTLDVIQTPSATPNPTETGTIIPSTIPTSIGLTATPIVLSTDTIVATPTIVPTATATLPPTRPTVEGTIEVRQPSIHLPIILLSSE